MPDNEKNITNNEFPRFSVRGKFFFYGLAASVLLTLVYFVIVSLLESVDHAITQFVSLSYLMVPLIVGFGVQVGLLSFSRQLSKTLGTGTKGVASSGGVSTASMIACCAHHVSDVFPLLGLASLTLFLTEFQAPFILVGVFSNIIGILVILLSMQKNGLLSLLPPRGFPGKLANVNLKKMRNYTLVLATMIVISSFLWVGFANSTNPRTDNSGIIVLQTITLSQNGLTVQATPSPFAYGDEVKFNLGMNTHSGDLNFDLTKVAILEDGNGTRYTPTNWTGSAAGGHHVEGTLTFPPLLGNQTSMKLILTGVYGADWVFVWQL